MAAYPLWSAHPLRLGSTKQGRSPDAPLLGQEQAPLRGAGDALRCVDRSVGQDRHASGAAQVQHDDPSLTLRRGAFLEGVSQLPCLGSGPGVLSMKALGLDLDELLTRQL